MKKLELSLNPEMFSYIEVSNRFLYGIFEEEMEEHIDSICEEILGTYTRFRKDTPWMKEEESFLAAQYSVVETSLGALKEYMLPNRPSNLLN